MKNDNGFYYILEKFDLNQKINSIPMNQLLHLYIYIFTKIHSTFIFCTSVSYILNVICWIKLLKKILHQIIYWIFNLVIDIYYIPSLFIPICMHFFKRHAWHWFLCALSTTHLPVPAWHLKPKYIHTYILSKYRKLIKRTC